MGEKSSSTDSRKRIVCPLDPRHTIFEDTLELHIKKKCPSIKDREYMERQSYYHKDINAGIPCESDEGLLKVSRNQQGTQVLKTISFDILKQFLLRVDLAHQKHVPEIFSKYLQHSYCKQSHQSQDKIKHDIQESSLVGTFSYVLRGNPIAHMDDLKLIDSSLAYVEMGAGKGNLTHLVKQISLATQSVLIDKQKCFRNKVLKK
jgi:tRNA:m4X modification enzyme